jgi:hypothetical protein
LHERKINVIRVATKLLTFCWSPLKARLQPTYLLSDHNKMAALFRVEALVGRRPSQLLAALLAFCHLWPGANSHVLYSLPVYIVASANFAALLRE